MTDAMKLSCAGFILFIFRSVIHRSLAGLLPSPRPRPRSLPAEEQRCGFLSLPPESQTEPGQAAEPGPAPPGGAEGGDPAPAHMDNDKSRLFCLKQKMRYFQEIIESIQIEFDTDKKIHM